MVHKNARAVKEKGSDLFFPSQVTGVRRQVRKNKLDPFSRYTPGGSGLAASLPTTVVHARTFQPVTSPPVT